MPTYTRVIVEREDGTRVTELLRGTPLDGLMKTTALEAAWMLGVWLMRNDSSGDPTKILQVRSAMQALRREPDETSLRVRSVLATEGSLPRKLGPPVKAPNRIV